MQNRGAQLRRHDMRSTAEAPTCIVAGRARHSRALRLRFCFAGMDAPASAADQVFAIPDLARKIAALAAKGDDSGKVLAATDRICRAFYSANTPLWYKLCRTCFPSTGLLAGSFAAVTESEPTSVRRAFSRRMVAKTCVGAPLPYLQRWTCNDYLFTFEILQEGSRVFYGNFGSVSDYAPRKRPYRAYGKSSETARTRKPLNLRTSDVDDLVARVFVLRSDGAVACLLNASAEIDEPEYASEYFTGALCSDELSYHFESVGALPLLQWRDGERVTSFTYDSEYPGGGLNVTLRIRCKLGGLSKEEHSSSSLSTSQHEIFTARDWYEEHSYKDSKPVVAVRGATLQFHNLSWDQAGGGDDNNDQMCDYVLLMGLGLLHFTTSDTETRKIHRRCDDGHFRERMDR